MQKAFIGIIIIFTGLLSGVIFFWWPKYRDFNDFRSNIKEKKIELDNREKYFLELTDASSKLKEYRTELSKIDTALPANSYIVPELIDFLAEKGSQSGFILEQVNLDGISALVKDSDIKEVSLTLTLSGFYTGLKSFLYNLQKSSRLIEVSSINFDEPDPAGIFSIELKIKSHFYQKFD